MLIDRRIEEKSLRIPKKIHDTNISINQEFVTNTFFLLTAVKIPKELSNKNLDKVFENLQKKFKPKSQQKSKLILKNLRKSRS